jgi:hypothetical protein
MSLLVRVSHRSLLLYPGVFDALLCGKVVGAGSGFMGIQRTAQSPTVPNVESFLTMFNHRTLC